SASTDPSWSSGSGARTSTRTPRSRRSSGALTPTSRGPRCGPRPWTRASKAGRTGPGAELSGSATEGFPMRAVTCVLLLLVPAVGWADEVKAVTTGRQGDRPVKFEGGLGTFYEGLVVAVLGTCSVDGEGSREQWDKALKADHLRVQFARPRVFAAGGDKREVEADEILITISATA